MYRQYWTQYYFEKLENFYGAFPFTNPELIVEEKKEKEKQNKTKNLLWSDPRPS